MALPGNKGCSLRALLIARNICKWQVSSSSADPVGNVTVYPQTSHPQQRSSAVVVGVCFRRHTVGSVPAPSQESQPWQLAARALCHSGSGAHIKGRQKQFPLTAHKVFSLSSCLYRDGVMKTIPLLQDHGGT